jgi:hypothetical protein
MRWNWSHSAIAPGLLVLGEAAWATMICNLATRGIGSGLPLVAYFALAIPAFLAVTVGSGARFLAGRDGWTKPIVGALAITAVVAIALSAGSLGAVFGAGNLIRIATEPWTVRGAPDGSLVILAFGLSIAAWARGLCLGASPMSTARVLHSAIAALATFVTLVVLLRFDHLEARGTSVGACIAWVLYCFVADLFVASLVRESELSLVRRGRSIRRVDRAWIVILGAAALVIVVFALVAAALSGPGQSVAAWPLDRLRHGAYLVLAWLLRQKAGTVKTTTGPHGRPFTVPLAVRLTILGLIIATVFWLLWFLFRSVRFRLRPRFRPAHGSDEEDEDRESIFSWRHLFTQLRGLFRWRHRRGALVLALAGVSDGISAGPGGVRGQYLRFLATARTEGLGRAPDETTRELEHRVTTVGDDGVDLELVGLTELYERVRYGDEPESAEMADLARRRSERIIEGLTTVRAPGAVPDGE